MSRVILHCDLNNFYASVECLLNPALRDQRVAVGGSVEERHGIILAKNENAKKMGVKTGEAIWEAKRKCPRLIVVPPRFENYVYYSQRVREIYARYTDLVEPFGMDECWLDVTGSAALFGDGREIADRIREEVKRELGLTISAGVSFNKVFAKLGSDMKKPDATTVISRDNFKEMIYGLPASDMIGVGRATEENLRRIGVDTIGELAALSRETLRIRMGKHGEEMWAYANGLDCSPVMHCEHHDEEKSIGRGITAMRDLTSDNDVHVVMLAMATDVARKLRRSGLLATGVQIDLRDSELVVRQFQCPLPFETCNAGVIERTAFQLFKTRYRWEKPLRSLTVRAIRLAPGGGGRQLGFELSAKDLDRQERLDAVTDELAGRFGKGTVIPMSLLNNGLVPALQPDGMKMPGMMRK